MIKRNIFKRVLAAVLSIAMILPGSGLTAFALENPGTVAGAEETVVISSGITERKTNFNDGWKFYLGDNSAASGANFNDSSWEDVTLPHDFSISQDFTTSGEAESGFLPGGTGWYRKTFTLTRSEEDKNIVLSFDGVYSDAYVYVNGEYIGENHYGYTSFAFDITDYVECDGITENTIAVKVVNDVPSSRWYSGSGIYRDVTLIVTDKVHVAYNGIYVTTPGISSGDGTVMTEVELENDSENAVDVTVKNTVYTKSGEAVSETAESAGTIEGKSSAAITASPAVSDPMLWSPDSPTLYYVRTEVYADGILTDTCDTEFGFRWYSFDSENGFYLNGDALKINGVCMHHDQGAAGSAAYYDAMYRQLVSMKDMGANAVRIAHNPADEDFIDICSELGLLVIEEAFDGWTYSKNGNVNDFGKYFNAAVGGDNEILGGTGSMTWAEYAVKSMVKRDRNDPSVILWSIGNEIQEGAGSDNTYPTIAGNLIDWINEIDHTRPATIGDNTRPLDAESSDIAQVLKVIVEKGGIPGFNYVRNTEMMENLHSVWGTMYSSETSSSISSRGTYRTMSADGLHLTSYDENTVSWGLTAHDSMWNTLTNDYVAGEFIWTGWDYIGEPTPWNGTGSGSVYGREAAPNSSYFGIVDTAGFEKDTYYLYQSQWNQESTTLHLVTAWDADNLYTDSNGQTPVAVYSNAPEVKLYRNGTLIGTAVRQVNTTAAGHTYYTYTPESLSENCSVTQASGADSLYATFYVTYEEGTISAVACDEDGNEIAGTSGKKSVTTPGAASRLEVTQNKTVIDADGQSLVYIEVEVQDANGNLDTAAAETVSFSLSGEGEIVGVDNGDQASVEKYQQSSVLTGSDSAHIDSYAGKAAVIVKSTKTAGNITVDITADGLTGGTAEIATTAVDNGTPSKGIISYKMVKDYSVLAGTEPELQTDAAGILADGTMVDGSVTWEEISSEIYNNAGDHTITGTLNFAEYEPLTVTARLHVIADVIAVQNISTATAEGAVPTLPDTVRGIRTDGTVTGEFEVAWDPVSADEFDRIDDIVTVNGTAAIIGEVSLPVTCTVRVTEAVNTESTNVAPLVSSLTQDIEAEYQSDSLEAVINGVTDFADNTSERWTNWNNRYTSATATLTFSWDTAQLLSGCNLYYYFDNCAAAPEKAEFQYSLDGSTYSDISYTSEIVQTASLGEEIAYTFNSVINPVSVRIILTQQNGTSGVNCVGLIEAEMMTYAGSIELNESADLSGVFVDGTVVSGFDADVLTYQETGSEVTAVTDVNAGITVLPPDADGVVRILSISEDGSTEKTYEVTLAEECTHSWDDGVVTKEATTEEEGLRTYTCTICGDTKTETIPKLEPVPETPDLSLNVSQNNGKIRMTAEVADYENADKYYEITGQGFVYITKSLLGAKSLNVYTPGRTKAMIRSIGDTGTYSYSMTPKTSSTVYVIRAYMSYKNNSGKTVYVYTDPIYTSYMQLN